MKPDEIKEIIGKLDEGISKENARVSIQKYGGELEEAFIVATENGYLRLGVEFLKAGITPYLPPEKSLGERPHAIDVEIDYLITEDSDVHFDYFERSEDIQVATHEESWVDKAITIAFLGAMVSILAFALVGLVAILKALF
jgi:hypothetical protein